jgi:hypothetical protein
MNVLHSIDHTHILGAFLVGVGAGFLAYVVDTYIVARLEPMIGVTPGTL